MTDERIKVWPKEGLIVRDPVTRAPIEPGQEVPASREILRLMRAGDLVGKDPARVGDKEHGVAPASTDDDDHDREPV